MIGSFEKKPEKGGIPESASPPARNARKVNGISFRRPPILRMSCSPPRAWIRSPAARNSVALKKACIIRWKIASA